MNVRFHAAAVEDLTAAGDWYELRRTGLGGDLLEEVDQALVIIAERPRSWPRWAGLPDALDVRMFRLVRFPFAVVYRLRADEALILAVAHHSRRPGVLAEAIA